MTSGEKQSKTNKITKFKGLQITGMPAKTLPKKLLQLLTLALYQHTFFTCFLGGSGVKRICLPMQERQETPVQSLGQEDPLEKKMATHSNIAWRISWTKEPSRLPSLGSQRGRHVWLSTHPCNLKLEVPGGVSCRLSLDQILMTQKSEQWQKQSPSQLRVGYI